MLAGVASLALIAGCGGDAVATGFGSRDDVRSHLSGLGFDGWESSPLSTGEERWMGQADGHTAEVIGPADGVDRVTLMLGIAPDTTTQAAELLAGTMREYAPDAREWATDQIVALGRGSDGGTRTFGDVTVEVAGLVLADGAIATVALDHD